MYQLLRNFLEEWLAWVDAGAPAHKIFATDQGLCDNLCDWHSGPGSELQRLKHQLGDMFEADGLHRRHPFNQSVRDFLEEEGSYHLNEERVAWVRRKLS